MATARSSSKRRLNICEEPCTLVYTLLNEDLLNLNFDHFFLIVRDLHSYMVEDIVPHPETNCVHVKLGYLASLKNARAKLGKLRKYVAVSKLSTFIKDDELSTLDALRQRFGFGAQALDSDEEEDVQKVKCPAKKRKMFRNMSSTPEEVSE